MNKLFTYKISLYIQGWDESKIGIEAQTQEEADNIVLDAVKNGTISELIDSDFCVYSETNLDYGTVKFLTPSDMGGSKTLEICRKGEEKIYSNEETVPNQSYPTLPTLDEIKQLISSAISYLENDIPCIMEEELHEEADSALNNLQRLYNICEITPQLIFRSELTK